MRLYRPLRNRTTSVALSNQSPTTIDLNVGIAGVRIIATVDVWVYIGPPITILSMTGAQAFLLPAGRVEVYAVAPGDHIRVSSTSLATGHFLTTELGL